MKVNIIFCISSLLLHLLNQLFMKWRLCQFLTGFIILEQVCIAAADVNRIDLIDQCLISLHNEFPGSLRVKRLQVLKLELSEK